MSVGQIHTAEGKRKVYSTFNFSQNNRMLMAAAQMAGDGLMLTLISYVSFRFVGYLHNEMGSIEYLPYFALTIGTTSIMILSFAISGAYDVFEDLNSIAILRSTFRCFVLVIMLLTACLFIFKISDNVSRLWLGTWAITSAIALCGFRLLTASVAQRLRRGGHL